jgi:toxin ParE1/3/4
VSVSWSEKSIADLEAIRRYLTGSSVGYGHSFIDRIISRAESLDGRPRFGWEVAEYGDPDIREVFEHPYRILYRVFGSDVQVIAVIHASRRMPKLPLG